MIMVSIERKCIGSRWKYLVDHLPAEDVLDCLIEKGNCSIDDFDHLAKNCTSKDKTRWLLNKLVKSAPGYLDVLIDCVRTLELYHIVDVLEQAKRDNTIAPNLVPESNNNGAKELKQEEQDEENAGRPEVRDANNNGQDHHHHSSGQCHYSARCCYNDHINATQRLMPIGVGATDRSLLRSDPYRTTSSRSSISSSESGWSFPDNTTPSGNHPLGTMSSRSSDTSRYSSISMQSYLPSEPEPDYDDVQTLAGIRSDEPPPDYEDPQCFDADPTYQQLNP